MAWLSDNPRAELWGEIINEARFFYTSSPPDR